MGGKKIIIKQKDIDRLLDSFLNEQENEPSTEPRNETPSTSEPLMLGVDVDGNYIVMKNALTEKPEIVLGIKN